MSKIVAGITMSVDGYITGPDDGPGQGLGAGGERLHYWVFGGPWDYESSGLGEASGEDKAYLDEMTGANGAVIAGRNTYEVGRALAGRRQPVGRPLFIVTHRPGEQPDGGGFTFTGSLAEAVEQASAAAGDKQVMLMGGADLIRQGASRGVPRRADRHRRAGGARRRQAAVRRVQPVARPRASVGQAVPVRQFIPTG